MKQVKNKAIAMGIFTGLLPIYIAYGQSEVEPKPRIVGQNLWFFSAILPCKINERDFTALSLSFDGVHNPPTTKPEKDLTRPLWIDVWAGGVGNAAQLRLGNYDYARDLPRIVTRGEDAYFFFFRTLESIVPTAPVMRRSAGGWAWQTLDTVESDVRREVRFADFAKWKVYDANAQEIAGISAVKPSLSEKAIDLGVWVEGKKSRGVAGEPAILPDVINPQRPPLPYTALYFYECGMDGAKVTKLPIVGVETDDATDATRTHFPPLAKMASELRSDDEVFFGLPAVVPATETSIYYWYVIRSKSLPQKCKFVLAQFDGHKAKALDGMIYELPAALHLWNGVSWVKSDKQPWWMYQSYLKVFIQPLVGFDAKGQLIVHRPPEFYIREIN